MRKYTLTQRKKSSQRFLAWLVLLSLILAFAGCRQKITPTSFSPPPKEAAPAGDVLPYQNPALPVEARVQDLLDRMTLGEKIGQMTQVEKGSIRENNITDMFIGSLLSGGGAYPDKNTPQGWADMVNAFQERALQTRLGIPLLYGVDAIHGHNNVWGAVIFPHNVGLGATRDPDLLRRIGRATAEEVAATSIYWNFAPVLAVPQDIRWGRTYEAYGEDTELVASLGTAYLRGLQGDDLSAPLTVLATPKHFVGDGGTAWGSSTSRDYIIDQGVTDVDEATLRAVHLPPYVDAIDAGAMSVMVSFSSWGGMKMHAQKYLISDVLKGELGFEGFVISDWAGIDQISEDYYEAVVTAINAGIDMNMVPYRYDIFVPTLTSAVKEGAVPLERIDDAVRRILTAKFQLGLFERPFADKSLLATVGSDEHRALAREAVQKSLVLLKNDNGALPITQEAALIYVAGELADDIGAQCGGWTIEWQGQSGNITTGTTILQGIQEAAPRDTTVQYNPLGEYDDQVDENGNPIMADVAIVVVGEEPYAEGEGDEADLALSAFDAALIQRAREHSHKLIVILISGRPLIITEQLALADAFVAAWLPGSEGPGVADALFGDAPFSGKLSFTWPRSMDQISFDFDNLPTEDQRAPLFPFGYGLE